MSKLYLNHSPIHNAFLVQEPEEFATSFMQKDLEAFVRKIFLHYQKVLPNGRHLGNIHINPTNEEFSQLLKERKALIPYCIWNSARDIRTIVKNSDTLLYGVECDVDNVINIIRQMKSKIYCANIIRDCLPEFANEFVSSDKRNLQQKAMEFMKAVKSPIVIKPEYTQGGFGSSIIHSEEELRKYAENLKNADYFQKLEVQENERFIIEKYIPRTSHPVFGITNTSSASTISTPFNNDILIWNAHSQGVEHRGGIYPSISKQQPIREVHQKAAEILAKTGYIGVFEVEHLEDKFGEINSRHPHSYALLRFLRENYPDKACYSDTIQATKEQLMNIEVTRLFDGEKGILVYALMQEHSNISARLACIDDTAEKAKERIEEIKNGKNQIFNN